MKRTDTHRPSIIVPEDYFFIACDYLGGGLEAIGFLGEREAFRAHMRMTDGKFAAHHNSGTCHICGARALYIARFHHTTTNTYIQTGMDCAEKMGIGDPILFRNFRKRVKEGLKTRRGKLRAREFLAKEFGTQADHVWSIYENPERKDTDVMPREEATIWDVVGKLVKYGSISGPQCNLIAKLLARIDERPAIEAARAAEMATALPVPQVDGRIKICGTVISTRVESSPYGDTRKILVKHADGWKVWGTCPRELCDAGDAIKGATVEFVAAITRSPKDEKFGFFNRPTKPTIVTPAPETT